jgi:hypothetical protein
LQHGSAYAGALRQLHHGAHLPYLSPRIARMAADHGWHIQFYPAPTDLADYADQLLALPNRVGRWTPAQP